MTDALQLISGGTVEVILPEELAGRLKQAAREGRPLRVKAGFDPTAPDLHLGHLVLLRKLRQFQELGHEIYFVIGDFTGMIGDPSGVSTTRPALTRDQVLENARTYERQVFRVLDRDRVKIVFNSEWLRGLGTDGLIRLAARYRVARMLERDDFKRRLQEQRPIAIHEFLYPLLQGYDSVALRADVELGGTDQKFNLLVGRDLQRDEGQPPQIVITLPLLEGTDGRQKMSKSLDNAIGLEEPPEQIFGKIMSLSDETMLCYYQVFLPDRVEEVRAGHPMDAKLQLAAQIVGWLHGRDEADAARADFDRKFRRRSPEGPIKAEELRVGPASLLHVLTQSGISGSQARRLIRQGAVELDGKVVSDPTHSLPEGSHLIKVGKARFIRVTCAPTGRQPG